MNVWCYVIVFGSFCGCLTQSKSPACTTPNGEASSCIPVLDCPALQTALNSKTQVGTQFVEASRCPQDSQLVCCGAHGHLDLNLNRPMPKAEREMLLPNKTYCGKQHTDDYYYTGNDTSVDEFPWMVYIISKDRLLNSNNKFEGNVGVGVIISKRYILSEKRDYNTSSVRIGQHHILKESSCIGTDFGDDCTDPSKVISVEKMHTRPNSTVALLRLNSTIVYTDFIRPICLPFKGFPTPQEGDTIHVSGWGAERFIEGSKLQVKKRLMHTVLNQALCEKGNPIPQPLCGVIFKNSTAFVCPEENGGPIMFKHRNNWVVEGIISGTRGCGRHQPVSGERVLQDTVAWIMENMEP